MGEEKIMNAVALACVCLFITGVISAIVALTTEKTWPFIWAVGITLLVLAMTWNGINSEYSDGTRVGTVVKFSYKGLLYKSWEGEILVTAQGASAGYTFDFNVSNPLIVDAITIALNNGQRVKLHYLQWFINPVRIESDYVIDSVTTQYNGELSK